MQNEIDTFTQRLSATPELPQDLYGGVIRTIRRRHIIVRTVQALVATAIIGVSAVLLGPGARPSTDTELAELDSELESMQSFVNGSSLQDEYAQYALVNEDWGDGVEE